MKLSARLKSGFSAFAFLAASISAAHAEAPLRIGLMGVLSGPQAVLGQQIRDGFMLGIKHSGGKLGGLETQVIVQDDELKPDVAIGKVKQLLERDKVQFVVGPTFSNILLAIHKPVIEANVFLISPNAGTSNFAGKQCSPYFFVTSYQNDQVHEVLGKYAQDQGYKRVFLMTPNYQAGKDSMAGFKRHFKGEVVDEVLTPLGQLDFSAELARVAAAKPDAFFTFMPGGMGVNLVKQYSQAKLADSIPFLSAFTIDESTLPAQQDAALGLFGAMTWAPSVENPENKKFVTDYEKEYGSVPGSYAMQGYDAALLINSAVGSVGGNLDNKDALRAALKKADFKSPRGPFKFNNNGYPIQNFYLVKPVKRADGKYQTEIIRKVFSDYGDVYAADCPLK